MKNLFIITILLLSFNFAQAQNFFSDGQSEKAQEQGFFDRESTPDQGEDAGNPGYTPPEEAPIDDWLFLLPLLGIAVGGYYLLKHRRENVTE